MMAASPALLQISPHRKQFLDHALLYLFSLDVESDMDREELGFVPGGVRVTIFARPGLSRVYHLARERTIPGLGFEALSGTLSWGGDWVYWREDDIEQSEVRASITLDDDAVIHMSYRVVTFLGPGGFRRIVGEKRGSKIGREDEPVNWPVVTSPRFATSDPRYRWIGEYQCIGHGLVQIVKSEVRRLTYDIYAMT
jgi:hypothetical protein